MSQEPTENTPQQMSANLRDIVRFYAVMAFLFLAGTVAYGLPLLERPIYRRTPIGWIVVTFPVAMGIAFAITAYSLKRRHRWAWRASMALAILLGSLAFGSAVAFLVLEPNQKEIAILPAAFAFASFVACIRLIEVRDWFPDPHTGLLPEDASRDCDDTGV